MAAFTFGLFVPHGDSAERISGKQQTRKLQFKSSNFHAAHVTDHRPPVNARSWKTETSTQEAILVPQPRRVGQGF